MKADNQDRKGTSEKLRLIFGLLFRKKDGDSQSNGKNNLFVRLIFTALAFGAMVSLSYVFVHKVIRENLSRNAENVMFVVQNQVENDLNNPKMYLTGFSRTIRTAILNGDDKNRIKECLTDLSKYVHSNIQGISGFDGFFGYFYMPEESVFIDDSTFDFSADFDPTDRPWYKNTTTNHGVVTETVSYADIVTGGDVLIYSICIHDDDDNLLGVVCMRLKIDEIGERVINVAIGRGGWGMLISREFIVLAHPNKPFVDIDARDPSFPPHIYTPQMMRGENVSEGSMKDYHGDKSLAFFRKLSNGWYLGLVTPERPYFQSLITLAYTLGILGALSAAALMMILIRIDMARNKSDRESKYKSAFLANMSHEIRTPMNAIIGMTTIGKSADNIERKDYCLNKIEDASNHLLGVINDILDMSKIEANKFELVNDEFNFEKMLQRVVNVVNFRIDEKHHKFTVHIDKNIPRFVVGDDQRVAQVITNLLSNAIKFTPEYGSITLDVQLLREEEDGYYNLQISVSDTGIGLTPEQQARVFISFEQAESSTTRKYGGTGLGLPISKNIVELMGGNIWLESEYNKGTTFTFNIRVKSGSRIHEGLLDTDVNLSNIRIMAVDDDQDILNYFAEIAEGFGVACCDTATSGEEALGLVVRNGEYHIYFVDWRMPIMDGLQLASEIKKRTSSKSVVIMITAAEWTSIEADAKKAGVDKFLSKPLFPSAIMDTIKECISVDHQQMENAQVDINGIFEGRKILLAEDVEINREIVQALLEPTNVKIDCAENGLEAVKMFEKTPDYDMVLMDLQMPIMDGYEATKQIRALNIPEAKTARIIAMTANVFRDDIERCQEAGMNNHIGKPLNFEEVVEKMRMYMLAA